MRPDDSYLPDDIERIIVDYRSSNSHLEDPSRRYIVAEPAIVQSLVRTVNSLTEVSPETVIGARDNGQGASMRFVSRAGSEVMVTVRPAHRLITVGNSGALTDTAGVWREVSRVLGISHDGSGSS